MGLERYLNYLVPNRLFHEMDYLLRHSVHVRLINVHLFRAMIGCFSYIFHLWRGNAF